MLTESDKTLIRMATYIAVLEQANTAQAKRIAELEKQLLPQTDADTIHYRSD